MEALREFIATVGFIAAVILCAAAFATDVNWLYLTVGVVLFGVVYVVWPSKRRGKRDDGNPIIDIIEVIIEFPVELILWLLRGLWRILTSLFGGKGGIDIDI